ncbi:rhs element Vgr family protein, partial [Escherichia coli 95.0183]
RRCRDAGVQVPR